MSIIDDISDICAAVHRLCVDDDDMTGPLAFDAMRALLTLRNLIDHHAAVLTAALDRLRVAKDHGRSTRELLIVMGVAPAVAQRLIRIAGSLTTLPTLAAHAADGVISGEHADAIVRGIEHIGKRSPEPIDDTQRLNHVTDLLAQHFSGATPAEIIDRARTLGNLIADDTLGGVPAAEDRSINTLTKSKTTDGRIHVEADLDVEVGEKFQAAMERHGAPRPEPDGSPDARSTERRLADALETILDIAAAGGNDAAMVPRTHVLLTIPADNPRLSELEHMGSVTRATMNRLACDPTITPLLVDGETVPLDVGRDKRLFTPAQRTALYIRDRCCIKCGAPAERCHAHHIDHWSQGGDTCLENGCLLCPSCHADVHHNGWEVFIGADHHPWLTPPATVDPHRRPVPSYNRRTLTLDAVAVAA
ncbi:HNH endonuclease signature motif containing protein [Gordonia sp. OPL2]|uniref:HNH endonuclease n=1 Tax=Gordonia sp. OPL2 TaxID=2486274 RepID=UPI0021CCFE07|nr:HNH endonuclease signature motif containing protein [Gordonia sp. OPL2]